MKKIVSIIIIGILLSGCAKEFLERDSLTSLANETFWQNENDALMALAGCYSALQSPGVYDSDPWGGGMLRTDYMSDNGYANWKWMAGGALARGEHSTTDGMVTFTWGELYKTVVRCNQVLKYVPEMDSESIDADVSTLIIGEAKFIRALAYNLLTALYRDVPLVLEPQSVQEADVAKSDKATVVGQIVKDLEEAAAVLPPTVGGNDWGRASKGAALSLLARVHLWNGNYAEAAAKADEVINMGAYSLYPDYAELFKTENEINSEVIFPVRFERGPDEDGANFAGYWGTGIVGYQRPLSNLAKDFYCSDGLPVAESPLFNPEDESENRDPRYNATIVGKGSVWNGSVVGNNKISFTGYTMRKYTEEGIAENKFDGPQDFYVLRYGHVLLIKAEALAEMSGSESEITALIDELRDRVGMPNVADVEGTGLSQSQLIDLVRHERRVETAFEGLRYFDLLRWDELKNVHTIINDVERPVYSKIAVYKWEDRFNVWPIPQAEVDINELLEQHNEW